MSFEDDAERAALAMEILEVAKRPSQVVMQLLRDQSSVADVAAELEDLANRFLDLSEGLMRLRQPQVMAHQG